MEEKVLRGKDATLRIESYYEKELDLEVKSAKEKLSSKTVNIRFGWKSAKLTIKHQVVRF